METVVSIMIFMMGTVFGSFLTLATYRIPLKKNITHERSFCPNCNHRLEFLDLIPVLSYIFLGGKCRYCKEKISPRYLIYEVFSGISFLLIYKSLNINFYALDIQNVEKLVFLSFIFFIYPMFAIISGIDKEKGYIQKNVFIYGIVVEVIYMIYLYTLAKVSIHRYVIYLFIMLVISLINKLINKPKIDYILMTLNFGLFITMMLGKNVIIISTICTLGAFLITFIEQKLKSKDKKFKFSICMWLAIFSELTWIVTNMIENYKF